MMFQEWKKQQLATDPEFKAEYEKLQAEKRIAKQFVLARQQLNLTQQELADRAGVRQSHLSRFESGKHKPSLTFIHKVASGLGKTVHIDIV